MMQTLFNTSDQAFHPHGFSVEDIRYCQQIQELYREFLLDNERLKDFDQEIERDGSFHLLQYNRHCQLASLMQPICSTPLQEPWTNGPPSFAHYTEVELPVGDLLPYSITTDPNDKNDPLCIFIPPEGPSPSPIIGEFVAQIVGRNGDWLKQITEQTGVHYIWYNANPSEQQPAPAWGSFQIWGPVERLYGAKQRLNKQIQHVIGKIHRKHS